MHSTMLSQTPLIGFISPLEPPRHSDSVAALARGRPVNEHDCPPTPAELEAVVAGRANPYGVPVPYTLLHLSGCGVQPLGATGSQDSVHQHAHRNLNGRRLPQMVPLEPNLPGMPRTDSFLNLTASGHQSRCGIDSLEPSSSADPRQRGSAAHREALESVPSTIPRDHQRAGKSSRGSVQHADTLTERSPLPETTHHHDSADRACRMGQPALQSQETLRAPQPALSSETPRAAMHAYGLPLVTAYHRHVVRHDQPGDLAVIEERRRLNQSAVGTAIMSPTAAAASGSSAATRQHPRHCACGGYRLRGRGFYEPYCLFHDSESKCSMQ